MKKIIFAILIIGLLVMGLASAGFWDWVTGKAAASRGKAFTGEQAGKSGVVPQEQGKKVGLWEKIFGSKEKTEKAAETRLSDLYPREASLSLEDFFNVAVANKEAVYPFSESTENAMVEDCMDNGFYRFNDEAGTMEYVQPCTDTITEDCASMEACEEFVEETVFAAGGSTSSKQFKVIRTYKLSGGGCITFVKYKDGTYGFEGC